MPSLKTFRLRIRSVQSTQKITKAMKMVAAAKLRRAQDQAMAARPYAEAMDNLMANLQEHGYNFEKIPYVLQLNKRDLPNVLPVDQLKNELQRKNEAVIESVAFQGVGVFETLKEIARQVLIELKQGG